MNKLLESKHDWIRANCPRSVKVRNLYLLSWGINKDGTLIAVVDGQRYTKSWVRHRDCRLPKTIKATLLNVFDAFNAEFFPLPLDSIIAEIDGIGKGRLD